MSFLVAGARRTEVHDNRTYEFYPQQYAVEPTPIENVRFALRHEPFDLGVMIAAMRAIGPTGFEQWGRREPTGSHSRRAWFFYERLLGEKLDLPDVKRGNYVHALNPRQHVGLQTRRNSKRHRVIDNLLGGPKLCPVVRQTERLRTAREARLDEEARKLLARYDRTVLMRAVNYLFTKETRSTFAIEGERPSADRGTRFVDVLRKAASIDVADSAGLVALQGAIVDPRYAAAGWRDFQNFVGQTISGYREEVHFISPKPADVADLMVGWRDLYRRLIDDDIDPVLAAAVVAFSFVFIHPFESGNGRIHRFLIHHVLARRGYSPSKTIFPVSAAIVRQQQQYDEALEAFSRPLFEHIEWDWSQDGDLVVQNDTHHLYRYFDATRFVEFLYDRIADTIRIDLEEELGFMTVFDSALQGVREVVDMPDRRASLLVRLIMQNGGELSGRKREQFIELSDEEISRLEDAVSRAMVLAGADAL